MPPENINERVAALEPQIEDLKRSMKERETFDYNILKEFLELKNSLNLLTWKVSFFTGIILIAGNQLIPWLFKKILP